MNTLEKLPKILWIKKGTKDIVGHPAEGTGFQKTYAVSVSLTKKGKWCFSWRDQDTLMFMRSAPVFYTREAAQDAAITAYAILTGKLRVGLRVTALSEGEI